MRGSTRGCSAGLAELGKNFLYFTVERETPGLGFGEDHPTVDDNVELTGFTRLSNDVDMETRFKGVGQPDRSIAIASRYAIEDFSSHTLTLARAPRAVQRRRNVYLPAGRSTNTAAATTELHNPSRSPIALCVIFRVVTILSETRQISLRSS
jgi:hypothetical protein